MSQSCRCYLQGWNDVFVLPGSRSDVQCLVLKFLVAFCVAFWEGAGRLFVFCQTPVCLQLDHMGVSIPCVRVTQEAACPFVLPECECWLGPCAGLRRGAEVLGKGSRLPLAEGRAKSGGVQTEGSGVFRVAEKRVEGKKPLGSPGEASREVPASPSHPVGGGARG